MTYDVGTKLKFIDCSPEDTPNRSVVGTVVESHDDGGFTVEYTDGVRLPYDQGSARSFRVLEYPEPSSPLTDLGQIREKIRQELSGYGHDTQECLDQDIMPIIEGLVNALNEVCTAATELSKSHRQFIDESSLPDASTLEAQYVMDSVLGKVQHSAPHDWTYISRFSATPNEIHQVLKGGLAEDVYLAYQREIGERVVAEATDIDSRRGGGPWPARLIDLEG